MVGTTTTCTSVLLYKDADVTPPRVQSASGIYLTLDNGQKILDATSGVGVAAIGHGNVRVKAAITAQLDRVAYCHPGYFRTPCMEQLAQQLVDSTHGNMSRACLVGSGSEAVEVAMKLARQFFLELSTPQLSRTHFIARKSSWHGATISALSLGEFYVRKCLFEPLLPDNVGRVSACNVYRELGKDESMEGYIARLAQELEDEFQRLGPQNVCAFVAEPVVGAALGCMPAVPGYFEAMQAVCHRHGALLIFDEVMCGMGRTGTLHAWEQEGVVPDIQAVGKCLGSGYGTISALLINERIVSALKEGSGLFAHGQTYQAHPLACAAALEVQCVVRDDNLLANTRSMGAYLGRLLNQRLGDHPNVGDIRGRGLMWGIEFVANKITKEPLDSGLCVSKRIHDRGLRKGYDICIFAATGSADGIMGDHILLTPPFIVQKGDVEMIVDRVRRVVYDEFEELKEAGTWNWKA
ncbi:pyridoxal phosphate-dependent transferase [Terfezia claveryi]|nr:pyridoxal phosphate-dependent transferase [Terfezia claveryi]